MRGALLGGVAPDRDTLAKLSAALDAAVVLLRAAIRTRAAAGGNSDITALLGLTTALSVAQGGTGATSVSEARRGLGLDQVTNISDADKVRPGTPIGDALATLEGRLVALTDRLTGTF